MNWRVRDGGTENKEISWHAQRFDIGTFLTVPGERAKLQELKLTLAE